MQFSIVNKTTAMQSVFGNRIDAEFYLPKYLDMDNIIHNTKYSLLNQITSKIDVGYVGSMVNEYTDNGVWLLQTQNVKDIFLEESKKIFINEAFHNYLCKSKVRTGDILIARSGSFGTASIYLENEDINSSDIIIIKPLWKKLNPYYLVTFLNSKYGIGQLLRFASGGVQGHVNLTILGNLKVCDLDDKFQKSIENIIKQSYSKNKLTQQLKKQAQVLLLTELGFLEWKPKQTPSFIKRYSDVDQAKRLDAEFFKPKYDEIITHIKATGKSVALGTLMSKIQRGKQPSYVETGLPVINSKHVANGEARVDTDNRMASKDPRDITIQCGDVLINGTGVGTIGRCAPYLRTDKALPDNHVTILRPSSGSIDPVYLSVFLNSIAGQYQVEQWFRGSSGQIELYPDDIAKFTIWEAPDEIQTAIRSHIEDSFKAKEDAAHLLECAKRAVEIAVEQDEQTATQWLQAHTAEVL